VKSRTVVKLETRFVCVMALLELSTMFSSTPGETIQNLGKSGLTKRVSYVDGGQVIRSLLEEDLVEMRWC